MRGRPPELVGGIRLNELRVNDVLNNATVNVVRMVRAELHDLADIVPRKLAVSCKDCKTNIL